MSRGEVDAGVVYRTDALIACDKVKCLFTLEHHSSIIYPIAATNRSANRKNALKFIDFVTNKKGKGILKSHGFEVP